MTRIDEIIGQFQGADYQETLAMLLDYSEALPPLPDEYKDARDAGFNRVMETSIYSVKRMRICDARNRRHEGLLPRGRLRHYPARSPVPENLIHSLSLTARHEAHVRPSAVYNRIR
jgi:hypothetical protein